MRLVKLRAIRGRFAGLVGAVLILATTFVPSFSQSPTGYTEFNWLFGNSSFSVHFNKGIPYNPFLDSVMVTPFGIAGNATATDQITGALLFYTDGSTVYDATHRAMPSATGGPAVTSNQGVTICPVPGSNDEYFIFIRDAGGDLVYSVVNMSIVGNPTSPGGQNLGDVTTWRQDLPGGVGDNVSEGMIIRPKANLADGYWLIIQQPNTTVYRVIDIGLGGIGAETPFDLLAAGAVPLDAAHFGGEASNRIAVAPQDANKSIHILQLDPNTGTLTFLSQVVNSATTDTSSPEAIYDVSLSNNFNTLFSSRHGSTGDAADLLAFDLQSPGATARSIFPGTLFRSFGLRQAPDGRIYHLYQESNGGPYLIGRIENPSAPIDSILYTQQVFQLRNFNGQQFPELLPPKQIIPPAPTLMTIGTCVTDTIWFFPEMDPFTDQFNWNFGDNSFPADGSAVSPGYLYPNPGSYSVQLLTSTGGNSSSSTPLNLNIGQTQLMIDLGADTVICPGETLRLEIDAMTFPQLQNVVWSTGDAGVSFIDVTQGGDYWVSGEDISSGCSLYDVINVEEYGLNTTIGMIWYFGNQAGLDFNQQPPVPLDNSAMNAQEGCSAWSDSNGDIVLYSNGQTVYNPQHAPMLNGSSLAGDATASQSALIVQFPTDETLYYVFTNTCTDPLSFVCNEFQLSYSVVDVKAAAGGDVVIKNKPLFKNNTERIAAVSFGNVTWLVAHEYGTNTFRAYPISGLGIGSPVLSSVGSIHQRTDGIEGVGYMKISNDGTKLAVALPTPGANTVELFDFDAATGVVSNPLVLDLNQPTGTVYGIEFSPNSNWLYATHTNFFGGGQSTIFHWHVDSTTVQGNVTDPGYIQNSLAQVPSGQTASALGALQQDPYGSIYVAINGASFLGIINSPDGLQDGTSLAFADLTGGQPLAAGTTSAMGLPNFIQNLSSQQPQPEIFIPPFACTGDVVSFSAVGTSQIDQFAWSIFDSSGGLVGSSMNQGDTITFNIGDDYVFSMRLFNRCLDPIAILTDTLTVFDSPIDPFGATAVPICDQSVTLTPYNADPHPEYTYLWNTGETTQNITVNAIGNYNLVITDPISGCTNTFDVFVGPPFTVDLGPDQTICDGTVLTLDSQANANDYIWEISIGGGPVQAVTGIGAFNPSTSRFLPLDQINPVPTAGLVNTFFVGVIDPIDPTCTVRDTIDITINSLPTLNISSTDATDCLIDDGTITIGDDPSDDLSYVLNGPAATSGLIPAGGGPVTLMNLGAGVYSVELTSNVTGCINTQTGIVINEPATFSITGSIPSPDDCDVNPAGSIEVTLSDPLIFPLQTVNLIDQTTSGIVQTFSNVPEDVVGTATFTISNVMFGLYSIEVFIAGCSAFDTDIDVIQPPTTDIQGPPVVTDCDPIDLSSVFTSGTGGAVIEWSLDDGASDPYKDISTNIYDNPGVFDIFIRASNINPAVSCDTTLQVQMVQTPEPVASIQVVDDCGTGTSQLTAVIDDPGYAGATFTYQWFQGSQPTTIGGGQSIVVNSTDFYYVVVSHANNLVCNFQVDPPVSVTPPIAFTVQVSSTPACTDSEFTVTAATFRDDLTYQWFINGAQQPETDNFLIREDLPGLYRAEATDVDGCVQADELNILINDPTPSLIEPVYPFCFQEDPTMPLTVDPGATYASYSWVDLTTNQVVATTSTFSTFNPGSFRADLTNASACVTSDAFNVIEDCEAKIFGPNAFRPSSGIEENRTFYLMTEYVEDFQIAIYNRWGELIFTSEERDFTWDGAVNGVVLPAGSYTYIVKYTKEFGGNGETLRQYGGVTLVR